MPKSKQHSAEKALRGTQQGYARKVGPNSNRNKRKSHITDYNHTTYTQNFIAKRNNANLTELGPPPQDTTAVVRMMDRKDKSIEGGSFHEK